MRCTYCYNPDIVLGKGHITITDALGFLRSRRGLLQGTVLSGGECTLHPTIFPLLETAKEYGFDVKIDTNGSRPKVLEALVERRLVDYIALDFKALEHRYQAITKSGLFPAFAESLALLNRSSVPFEVRTTVHSTLIGEDELYSMVAYLRQAQYEGNYYLQYFVNDVPTLAPLGYSASCIDTGALSTERIRVTIRE